MSSEEVVGAGSNREGGAWRNILATEQPRYSQGSEELVVREFFQDRTGGVFADVGAGHPVEDSTTCFLERHLGWSGIGVDALPEYGPMFAALRPNTRFFNNIVTDHSGTTEAFYRVVAAPGLSSTHPRRPWGDKILNAEQIEVPTTTLDALFEAQGLTTIDFLSIDVEESPLQALAGLDIQRFRPALVCIEAGGPKKGRRGPILAYFEENGYARVPRYGEGSGLMNFYFEPTPS